MGHAGSFDAPQARVYRDIIVTVASTRSSGSISFLCFFSLTTIIYRLASFYHVFSACLRKPCRFNPI